MNEYTLSERIQSNLDQIGNIQADMNQGTDRAVRQIDYQALLVLLMICLTVIAVCLADLEAKNALRSILRQLTPFPGMIIQGWGFRALQAKSEASFQTKRSGLSEGLNLHGQECCLPWPSVEQPAA